MTRSIVELKSVRGERQSTLTRGASEGDVQQATKKVTLLSWPQDKLAAAETMSPGGRCYGKLNQTPASSAATAPPP